MLLLFFMMLTLLPKGHDKLFEILCLLLKVMCCDVGSAEVISARAITGVHASCFIKFGMIKESRRSCALVMLYH